MAKFREVDLTDILKDFQNKNLEIQFERSISGTFKMEDASVNFDEKTGYIYIKNKINEFKINTTLVFGYEKQDDEIRIDLETIVIKIRI